MSEGPIHHWWKSHTPPKVSTDPKMAVHLAIIGENQRRYCGHRGAAWTTEAAKVTCSACIAAAIADGEPTRSDAPDKWVIINLVGGYVCSVCEMPVESEPCHEHQPRAWAAANGEAFTEPEPSSRRASDVPLWDDEALA